MVARQTQTRAFGLLGERVASLRVLWVLGLELGCVCLSRVRGKVCCFDGVVYLFGVSHTVSHTCGLIGPHVEVQREARVERGEAQLQRRREGEH